MPTRKSASVQRPVVFDVALAVLAPGGFASLFGGGIAEAATAVLTEYGYLALLLFVFAETSMLFPFLPSELVVPAAAALLVTGPLTLAAFVCVTAVGGVCGSLFAYYAFGAGSSKLVTRFGSRVRVSETEIERSRHWFRRWGESSVLWGRLFPGIRSLISISVGFAGMGVGQFAVYSGVGTGLLAAGVGGLVLVGVEVGLLDAFFAALSSLAAASVGAAQGAPVLAVAMVLLGLFALLLARNAYAARSREP
jgi:membrane protein DedA with SNARE-associated domain